MSREEWREYKWRATQRAQPLIDTSGQGREGTQIHEEDVRPLTFRAQLVLAAVAGAVAGVVVAIIDAVT